MLTVKDCINDLNNKDWYNNEFRKNKFLNGFETIKKYEKLFYNTHSQYSKLCDNKILPLLNNKIKQLRLFSNNNLIDVWDINPYYSKKYIIFCQGISAKKSDITLQKAYIDFADHGFGIIAFDYRGRGKSEGEFSQKNALGDISSIYCYLKSKGISDNDIGIIGHSMGSGAALDFAKRVKLGFVILLNPFSNAGDMAKNIARKVNMPALIKRIVCAMPSFLFPLKNKFDNISALSFVNSPVLIIHNKRDKTIPIQLARKLYKKNNKRNVIYLEIDGDDHEVNKEKIDICLDFLFSC